MQIDFIIMDITKITTNQSAVGKSVGVFVLVGESVGVLKQAKSIRLFRQKNNIIFLTNCLNGLLFGQNYYIIFLTR